MTNVKIVSPQVEDIDGAAYIGRGGAARIKKSDLKTINFRSYHTVFWELSSYPGDMGVVGSLTESQFAELDRGLAEVLSKIERFLENGGVLVLFAVSLPGVTLSFPTRSVMPAAIRYLMQYFDPQANQADKVVYIGPKTAEPLPAAAMNKIKYTHTLNASGIKPLLKDKQSGDVVGAYVHPPQGGVIMMMPSVDLFGGGIEHNMYMSWLNKMGKYLLATSSEPAWVEKFHLPEEVDLLKSQQKLYAEIKSLQSSVDLMQNELDTSRTLHRLYYETGNAFVAEVKVRLEKLGFQVEFGPDKLADLVARYGDEIISIEAKGIGNGVQKGNVSQAAGWGDEIEASLEITEDREDFHDAYCEILEKLGFDLTVLRKNPPVVRRLLIVNTYRDRSLEARTDVDFPDAAAREMKSRAVCGMTGLQLFGLVRDYQSSPKETSSLIQKIIRQVGQVDLYKDWKKFILLR